MLAPVEAPTSEDGGVWRGRAASVAVAVNVSAASSGVVALAGTLASTGAALTSVTVSVPEASAFVTPSLTRTVNGYAPGPCASVGVQVNTPLEPSMPAPDGPLTSENVSVWAGRSASVAVEVSREGATSGVVGLAAKWDSA